MSTGCLDESGDILRRDHTLHCLFLNFEGEIQKFPFSKLHSGTVLSNQTNQCVNQNNSAVIWQKLCFSPAYSVFAFQVACSLWELSTSEGCVLDTQSWMVVIVGNGETRWLSCSVLQRSLPLQWLNTYPDLISYWNSEVLTLATMFLHSVELSFVWAHFFIQRK